MNWRWLNQLTAHADLEEHHKHHVRAVRLLEIGAASREELEQATTKVKTAEAEVASQRQNFYCRAQPSAASDWAQVIIANYLRVSLPAPVSGSVIARSANPGEVIEAEQGDFAYR